jgi:UDP-glucose 4-epimerase
MSNAKKVIVFGGAGFVGSHTADALSDAGYEVVIFDRVQSPYLRADQQSIIGDIRDQEQVARAMRGCHCVYNFAGLADIDECRTRPLDTVRVNIEGNAVLLDVAAKIGIERYIFASTIYVYSEAGSFYRVSKQTCELYIEEYQRLHNLPFTILRYGTLYGRRADTRNSVYRYLHQALFNRQIVTSGTGEEIREYIHVEDAARSAVQVLGEEYANQYIILAGHHPMRFRDLLAMIKEIIGPDVQVNIQPIDQQQAQSAGLAHYSITPYNFRPKIGRKLVSNLYLDMGQGLLDVLDEIYQKRMMEQNEQS